MITHLVVTLLPNSHEVKKINNTYGGLLIDALNIITDKLNLTYSLIEPKDRQWGMQLENGSWTGLIRDIIDERADLALSELSMTKERSKYVDFTTYLRMTNLIIASCETSKDYGSSIFAPFDIGVWISVFIAIVLAIFICLIKLCFRIVHPFPTLRRFDYSDIKRVSSDIIGSLFKQNLTRLTTSNNKWFMSSWLVFIFFISSSYTSTIYVHLVTGKAPITIDSIDQLIELKDPEIHLIKGTATVDVFRTSKNKSYKKVWQSVTKGRGQIIESDWYKNIQPGQYIITNRIEAELRKLEGYPIYIGKTGFNFIQFSFVMRKSLPPKLKNDINKVITQLHLSGIYLGLLERHKLLIKSNNLKRRKEIKHEIGIVYIEELLTLFTLLCLGLGVAFCVLVSEYIYKLIVVTVLDAKNISLNI